MSLSDIDRCFIATNLANPDIRYILNEDNAENSLCRFEFVEILTRIADMKYVKSKLIENITIAVMTLITNFVKPLYISETEAAWGSLNWRKENLFTLDVNDVFSANIDNIHKLHKFY